MVEAASNAQCRNAPYVQPQQPAINASHPTPYPQIKHPAHAIKLEPNQETAVSVHLTTSNTIMYVIYVPLHIVYLVLRIMYATSV